MGRLFTYALTAFLIGIGLHSIYPWMRVPTDIWIGVACAFAFGIMCARERPRFFIVLVLVAACILGVWRFDVVPRDEVARAMHFSVPKRPSSRIFVELAAWRTALTARIGQALPREEATLATGMLYGDQELSRDQRDLLRRSGLLHLVAVSGANVTIIVNVLLGVILAFRFHRRHAFWIVSAGILAFLGFVGFSASVVRAGIMGWLVLLARHRGRIPTSSRVLLIAGSVMTFLTPTLLLFDRGFGLSFLATWGLLAWSPIFERAFAKLPNLLSLRNAAATTFAATLMTLPYLAWAFGRMSLAGLFTNLLALPLVPWIMLWTALVAAVGTLPGSVIIRLPTYGLVHLLLRIAHLADIFPWLDLRIPSMDLLSLVAVYLLLLKIWLLCREKTGLSTGSSLYFDIYCKRISEHIANVAKHFPYIAKRKP